MYSAPSTGDTATPTGALGLHRALPTNPDQVAVAREADLPQALLAEGYRARAKAGRDAVLVCRQRHATARVRTIGVEARAGLLRARRVIERAQHRKS